MKKWIAVILTVMLVSAVFAQTGVGVKLLWVMPLASFQYRAGNFATEISGMYLFSNYQGQGIGIVSGKYYFPSNNTARPYVGGGIGCWCYSDYDYYEYEKELRLIMVLDAFIGIEFALPYLPIKAFASLDVTCLVDQHNFGSTLANQLGVRYDF